MTLVWQAAEEAAQKLWEKHQQPDGLVDLQAICTAYGIRVRYTPDLPDGTSGMIVQEGEDKPARIYINSTESNERQRFTLAHELGHYVERQTIAKDGSYSFRDYRGKGYDLHEFYADQFAGALLMPSPLVLKKNPELSETGASLRALISAIDVAEQFGVSPSAASKRLERLVKQEVIPA